MIKLYLFKMIIIVVYSINIVIILEMIDLNIHVKFMTLIIYLKKDFEILLYHFVKAIIQNTYVI